MASSSSSTQEHEISYAFKGIAPEPVSSPAKWKKVVYDVFINHREKDVKSTVATAIYNTLDGMGLRVFLDEKELELGDFFPEELQDVTTNDSLHIAIFSKNYATSAWCLAELSFMVKTGTAIIPIFYDVEPSDLLGIYASAFSEHQQKGRYTSAKLEDWKEALQRVSDFNGHQLTNNDSGRLLNNILQSVLKIMKKDPLWVTDHAVGLDESVRNFEETVESAQSQQNVQIVGIVGMGGVGKTTLAKERYNRKSSSRDGSCFLFNVRDAKEVLHTLQRKLIEDLGLGTVSFDNKDVGRGIVASRLRSVQVFIVLDDVYHADQLDALLPEKDSLGSGSLIIVATRELGVLRMRDISTIYQMKGLQPSHAEELLCWHAFLQPSVMGGFEDLVEKFLDVCNGLPLSLKEIGSQLYGHSREYWVSLYIISLGNYHVMLERSWKLAS